jgi:hypothetical protein
MHRIDGSPCTHKNSTPEGGALPKLPADFATLTALSAISILPVLATYTTEGSIL